MCKKEDLILKGVRDTNVSDEKVKDCISKIYNIFSAKLGIDFGRHLGDLTYEDAVSVERALYHAVASVGYDTKTKAEYNVLKVLEVNCNI